MEKKENTNKTCEKCKYAKPHYYIYNGRFTRIANEMHCTNRKVTKKKFEKNFKEKLPCDCYESDEASVRETKEIVKKRLVNISEQLDNAIQVLESVIIDE